MTTSTLPKSVVDSIIGQLSAKDAKITKLEAARAKDLIYIVYDSELGQGIQTGDVDDFREFYAREPKQVELSDAEISRAMDKCRPEWEAAIAENDGSNYFRKDDIHSNAWIACRDFYSRVHQELVPSDFAVWA